MKIAYIEKGFQKKSQELIETANRIIEEYAAQGFDLTLRQLYYQMVARDIIPNNLKSYKRLGNVIDDARLAGLVDWERIVDRTRNVRANTHFDDPADVMQAALASYRIDKWEGQPYRVEVWIEKDALVGVIEGICRRLDVPFFATRGYNSQSEQWRAGRRLRGYIDQGQIPILFHLGDHDPSGIDMTRDIADRLQLFMGGAKVDRLALNFDQVEQYSPPPNPAKLTDSRADAYVAEFGRASWELDALEPNVIVALIEEAVAQYRDPDLWGESVKVEEEGRRLLRATANRWEDVVDFLGNGRG